MDFDYIKEYFFALGNSSYFGYQSHCFLMSNHFFEVFGC